MLHERNKRSRTQTYTTTGACQTETDRHCPRVTRGGTVVPVPTVAGPERVAGSTEWLSDRVTSRAAASEHREQVAHRETSRGIAERRNRVVAAQGPDFAVAVTLWISVDD